jgi:hypothetical protein
MDRSADAPSAQAAGWPARLLREETAIQRLRKVVGPPRLRTKVRKFDVFLFARHIPR